MTSFKIIQVTDCHMLPPGEKIFGSDPGRRCAPVSATSTAITPTRRLVHFHRRPGAQRRSRRL